MTYRVAGLDPAAFADAPIVAGPVRVRADRATPTLPGRAAIVYIHVHNAGAGCFMARAERFDA